MSWIANFEGDSAPGERFLHAQELTGKPPNKEIVTEWLQDLRTQGKAESTLETYRVSVHNFLKAITNKNFCDLTQKDINGWQQSQRYRNLAVNTQHLESRTVSSFLAWLGKVYGYGSPSKTRERVRVNIPKLGQDIQTRSEKIQDRIITPEEFEVMLEAATYVRDKALIAFLYDTGLRASECLALNKENVYMDATPAYVKVIHGKGDKRRTVPFTKATADMVGRYLASINWEHRKLEDPVWVAIRGGARLQYLGLRDMLRKISKAAGLKRKVKPHDFRHTAATRDAKSGKISTSVLQAKYGWADIKQADVYTHLNGDDINAAYAEAWGETETSIAGQIHKAMEYNRCDSCGTPLLPGDACHECAKQAEIRPLEERVRQLEKEAEHRQEQFEKMARRLVRSEIKRIFAEKGRKVPKEEDFESTKKKDLWDEQEIPDVDS